MVGKKHRRRAGNQPREEGNAVLGIDDHVNAAQIPQAHSPGRNGRPRARVHAKLGAAAAIAHAIADLPARRIHVLRGAKDHLVALRR